MSSSVSSSSSQQQSVAPSKIDPKTSARSVFKGVFDKDMQNLSVEEQIEFSPIVRDLKNKLEQTKAKTEKSTKKIDAYEKFRTHLTKFRDKLNYIRRPLSVADNAFLRKTSQITSTEGKGEDFIEVSASAGASNSDFTVSVKQLAKRNSIKIGKSDLTAATEVKNAIITDPPRVSTQAAIDAVDALDIDKDALGIPTNPFARTLYQYLKSQKDAGTEFNDIQSGVQEIFTEMSKGQISDGFDSISSAIVSDAGPGAGVTTIKSGTYYLYSMAGKWNIAETLKDYLSQAKLVADAIDEIPPGGDGNITQAQITDAIATALDEMGVEYDANGIPSNSPLAKLIAQAAYDAAGAGGAAAAAVTSAATAISSSASQIKDTIIAEFERLCPENSDERKNPFALYMIDSLKKEAAEEDANLESISQALIDKYNEYPDKCKIELTQGQTLQSVIDAINTTTKYSGVQAQALDTGFGSIILEISSVNTGLNFNIQIVNSDEADQKVHLLNGLPHSEDRGENAELMIDSQFMTSSSNDVRRNDKVSIKLIKINQDAHEQTVKITPNIPAAVEYIAGFIDQFNQLSAYIAQETERDPVTQMFKETATLGDDKFVMQIKTLLFSFVTRALGYEEGYRSFQDIGIKLVQTSADFENKIPAHKKLEIDPEALYKAITENYDQVKRIFEFNSETSDSRLSVTYHTGNYFSIPPMKVNLYPSAGLPVPNQGKRVKIDFLDTAGAVASSEYFTLSGTEGSYSFSCDDVNSKLYQTSFSFAGSIPEGAPGTPVTIDFKIIQGIADQIYGFVYDYTDDISSAQIGNITKEEQKLIEKSSKETSSIKIYEDKLQQERDRRARDISAKMQIASKAQLDVKIMESYLDAQNNM